MEEQTETLDEQQETLVEQQQILDGQAEIFDEEVVIIVLSYIKKESRELSKIGAERSNWELSIRAEHSK